MVTLGSKHRKHRKNKKAGKKPPEEPGLGEKDKQFLKEIGGRIRYDEERYGNGEKFYNKAPFSVYLRRLAMADTAKAVAGKVPGAQAFALMWEEALSEGVRYKVDFWKEYTTMKERFTDGFREYCTKKARYGLDNLSQDEKDCYLHWDKIQGEKLGLLLLAKKHQKKKKVAEEYKALSERYKQDISDYFAEVDGLIAYVKESGKGVLRATDDGQPSLLQQMLAQRQESYVRLIKAILGPMAQQ